MYSEEAAVTSKTSRLHLQPTDHQELRPFGSYELGAPEVQSHGMGDVRSGDVRTEPRNSRDATLNHQQHHATTYSRGAASSRPPVPRTFQHDLVGLPTKARIQSRSSVPTLSKARHVTFSSREPHLDKATGNIEHVRVSPANMSPSQSRQRFPRSFSYTPDFRSEQALNHHTIVHYDGDDYLRRNVHQHWKRTERTVDDDSEEEEEEHFVDGNFFFNHLVRDKAAEDYNMAEMLRERSRELQQRQLFGRSATAATLQDRRRSPTGMADRLSTSLPAEYFASKRAGYHYYMRRDRNRDWIDGGLVEDEGRISSSRERLQDMSFADGLEIEIPPRRHGGLGGGGLRQSVSADRLLMVSHSHRDQSEFGRRYFRSGHLARESMTPLPYLDHISQPLHVETKSHVTPEPSSLPSGLPLRLPVQTQTEPVKIPGVAHSIAEPVHPERHLKEATKEPAVVRPNRTMTSSFESISNMGRYNVRTGQFETVAEFEPKDSEPPLSDQYRTDSNSVASQNKIMDREVAPRPNSPLSQSGASYRPGYSESFQPRVSAPSPTVQRLRAMPQRAGFQTDFPSTLDRGQRDDLANRTWSAQMTDNQVQWKDAHLSSSWDPTRFRTVAQHSPLTVGEAPARVQQPPRLYSTSFQTPVPQEYPSTEDHFYGYDVSGRKAVTWQDQGSESLRPPATSFRLNLSRTHPSGNFQDNLGYSDHLEEASSRDETRSISREGIHYPSNDSLLRSLSVSDLHNVDQFALFEVSTSKLGWAESFMGTNWVDDMKQYKFVVVNRHEEVLFIGTEEDGSISNCVLSPYKSSFKVRILDASGQDVIHFRRLYPVKPKTNFAFGSKRKYRLEVATPSGYVIGNVEKTYDSDTYYVLEDRAGECLFLIQRSCICTCPLFWDYEFKILLPSGETEVGEISWSYLTAHNEQFNGTEISFPADLNMTSKIMLLGVCFLLNFSRWQSTYLDSLYNPRKRKDVATLLGSRLTAREENKEIAALLKTSPTDDNGFHGSPQSIEGEVNSTMKILTSLSEK